MKTFRRDCDRDLDTEGDKPSSRSGDGGGEGVCSKARNASETRALDLSADAATYGTGKHTC